MRPSIRLLSDDFVRQIVAEAIDILCTLGVGVDHPQTLSVLSDHGAKVDIERRHAAFTEDIIHEAIESAPSSIRLYDVEGNQTHNFSGHAVYFTPGSSALYVLDHLNKKMRAPTTRDYIEYTKVVSQLGHITSQSTAMIPSDVPAEISDSYRLFLSLLYCEKPVVTGAFSVESFGVMKDLQMAIRGTAESLRDRPLAVFSCCPTSPLHWNEVTCQNLVDYAHYSIPVEIVAMPLSGLVAPVTLTGTLIQHTAETLSGVVISQLVNPGTPVLYGGSPAIFDVRFETTPMGAIETMMIACAYNEIGKHLGLPTQAYISMSDAKQVDAQAGLETGMGAVLGALSGINSISGPGMIDFENCQSLEKLVLDNEVCGMALRLVEGIEPKEDFPARGILQELFEQRHLLISDHTRRYMNEEIFFPGPVIDRASKTRWEQEGELTLEERAHRQVKQLLESYEPPTLDEQTRNDLTERMEHEARRYGQQRLPTEH
ncbi:MAG: trimethylamine methyltransferase family protein [Pirellulaceae bacterium]|nr:trimethylamine methyltransferase family protein [Pirellulaceae bacterium]